MSAFWIAAIAAVALLGLVLVGGILLTVLAGDEQKMIARRLSKLSLRNKARLALALVRERRIPLPVRMIPPGLVLYLAMPTDVIPDVIPVIGYLDDVLIVGLGVALMVRFVPRCVLLEHLDRLESES